MAKAIAPLRSTVLLHRVRFCTTGCHCCLKNYRDDPQKGLEGYKNALQLGYTKTIPEVYEAANIKFDFSTDYIRSLRQFVRSELDAI